MDCRRRKGVGRLDPGEVEGLEKLEGSGQILLADLRTLLLSRLRNLREGGSW